MKLTVVIVEKRFLTITEVWKPDLSEQQLLFRGVTGPSEVFWTGMDVHLCQHLVAQIPSE